MKTLLGKEVTISSAGQIIDADMYAERVFGVDGYPNHLVAAVLESEEHILYQISNGRKIKFIPCKEEEIPSGKIAVFLSESGHVQQTCCYIQ